jgi:branched-chain amino acid transport system substrate-binding protein
VAEGLMYPNAWSPSFPITGNAAFVQNFIATYGGTAGAISADSPEAFSAAQVLQQAVTLAGSVANAKILTVLHSGKTFQTIQGPVTFDLSGQNTGIVTTLFQWQGGQVVSVWPKSTAAATLEYPKKAWP